MVELSDACRVAETQDNDSSGEDGEEGEEKEGESDGGVGDEADKDEEEEEEEEDEEKEKQANTSSSSGEEEEKQEEDGVDSAGRKRRGLLPAPKRRRVTGLVQERGPGFYERADGELHLRLEMVICDAERDGE